MAKLHELLAVMATKKNLGIKLLEETATKFKKPDFFSGLLKTLTLFEETVDREALESAERAEKVMQTNVTDTLEYLVAQLTDIENVIFDVNKTNTRALADIQFKGVTLVKDVPADHLRGLITRLTAFRTNVLEHVPTLDASRKWVLEPDGKTFKCENDEVTIKTKKVMKPLVLHPGTDKHAPQVKEITEDINVGKVTTIRTSGAIPSEKKAAMLKNIDLLIEETTKALQRANSTDVVPSPSLGKEIYKAILS